MKTYTALLLLLPFFSCSKEEIATSTEDHSYHLSFEMENESPGTLYLIQTSTDNRTFQTIYEMPFDKAKNGMYETALNIEKGNQIRIASKSAAGMSFSSIIKVQ